MGANGNRRDGPGDLDHVCFRCPAPDCIETMQFCPLVRLRKVRELEERAGLARRPDPAAWQAAVVEKMT